MAARRERLILAQLGLLLACGAAPPPIRDEPIPSTRDDPPTWVPAAATEGHTGDPVAVAFSGGAEQARALLVTLVLAIRDANEGAIEAALAERVAHAQVGLARTTWTRSALARQILAGAAATHVDPDAPFETLVDPASIRVIDVATHFDPGPIPPSVEESDEVVLFTPTTVGRRLLAGLGTTALVIRPGPTPVVVAR